jgi:hypothetical protein
MSILGKAVCERGQARKRARHPIGAYRIGMDCMRAPVPRGKIWRGNGIDGRNGLPKLRGGKSNPPASGKPPADTAETALNLCKQDIFWHDFVIGQFLVRCGTHAT